MSTDTFPGKFRHIGAQIEADLDVIGHMTSAIKLQVASLQRDVLATETCVLQRIDANKQATDRKFTESKEEIIEDAKRRIDEAKTTSRTASQSR